jgi:CHAT domain-containing protein
MTYKQPVDTYMQLIQLLLDCPNGMEPEILQAHQELVTTELVEFLLQYASYLNKQGHGSASQWLLSLAEQIMLDLSCATTDIKRIQQESAQFLRETFRLIAENRGDVQQLNLFLAQNQSKLDELLLQNFLVIIESFQDDESRQQLSLASVLGKFGNLISQFPLGQRKLNLEFGILAYQFALQTYTYETYPEIWAATQNNLALAYTERILGKRIDNLELALEITQSVLQRVSREIFPERWADAKHNLGIIYSSRIQGDRAANFEIAIAAYEQAMKVYTRESFPEDWAGIQNNLGEAYNNRIAGNRATNLELAIKIYNRSLEVRTIEKFPEWWAQTQANLSNVYSRRIQGNRAESLELAIKAAQQALKVYTREAFPGDWAKTQHNLASIYGTRLRGDHVENLELAITSLHLVLHIYTRERFPERWAKTKISLALAYKIRTRGNLVKNIDLALEAAKDALQVYSCEEFPEEWAHAQDNLAGIYLSRTQGDRAENLELAISAMKQALKVRTRDNFPENWARSQHNLAAAYSARICGDRADNLELAILGYQEVLQIHTREAFPEDWANAKNNLAATYSIRVRGERSNNLELATLNYQDALDVRTYETFPRDCRRTASNLGNLYLRQGKWQPCLDAYIKALTAAEALYQSCLLLDSKSVELAETDELPRHAAYAYARTNNFPKAIENLEQSRARGLSESLDRDRTNIDSLKAQNEPLYAQYKDITQQLRNLEVQQRDRMTSDDRHSITPEVLRNEATRLHQELTETIHQIRKQPGYETFLTLPTFEDVQKAVTPDSPLIYLLTTLVGSLALVVTSDETHSIWLNDFTNTHLTDLLQTWLAAYNQRHTNYKSWLDAIHTTTQQLWNPLMGPLVQQLQDKGIDRITLIPTGYLSFLPLHAAWTEDESKPTGRRYAIDDLHITYVPNAKSLTAAQSIANRVSADSIFAIDDPRQDLPNSEREIQAAIASFLPQVTILRHDRANTRAVKAALQNASIAHFSCHGTANLNEPLTSGLLMSDGLLTLKDIFALNLAESGGLRLAILSACETGMIGIENADEAISLPTGLLQAGVAAVISSLWSVDDRSTRILLTRFYDLWRKEHLEPSVALRQAQLWMRDTSSQQKAKYFQETNPDLFQSLILLPPDYFAHPFHWAAFSYTGV